MDYKGMSLIYFSPTNTTKGIIEEIDLTKLKN